MTTPYFSKFPIISYNNQNLVNIMCRVIIDSSVLADTSAYLPYDLEYQQTPETLAYDYYGDVNYYWLVNYTNNINDPYYDWYIQDDILNNILIGEYGTLANAQSTVVNYARQATNADDPYSGIRVTNLTYQSGNTVGIYEPNYAYTLANSNNDAKRNVNLVDSQYALSFDAELTSLLAS